LSRIINILHKVSVAKCSALKRRAVLNHEPEETRLHLLVAFANNQNFWGDRGIILVTQSINNGTKPRGQWISTGQYFKLVGVDIFESLDAEQRPQNVKICLAANPQIHVNSIVEKINTIA